MAYKVTAHDNEGRQIADLGVWGNIPSARQAMLDHASLIDLPDDTPWFGPDVGVLEGWFVGGYKTGRPLTEYLIMQA